MHTSNFLEALRGASLITDETLVREGCSLIDVTRSHAVVRVDVGGAPRWVLKRHKAPRGRFDGTLGRETRAYELAASNPAMARIMPRFEALLEGGIIALEAIDGVCAWRGPEPHTSTGCADAAVELVMTALATLHAATRVADTPTEPRELPWVLCAMDFDAPAFAWEGPSRAVLEHVASSPPSVRHLRRARAQWTPSCFIHGDSKLDNALLRYSPNGAEPSVVLIDWELSGRGDPLWDVAGVLLRDTCALCSQRAPNGRRWSGAIEPLARGIAAYQAAGGEAVQLERLLVLLAAWMIQTACSLAATRGPGWPEVPAPALAASELLGALGEVTDVLRRRMSDGRPIGE